MASKQISPFHSDHTSDNLEKVFLSKNKRKVLDFLFYWGRPITAGELVKHLDLKHSTLNSVLASLTYNEEEENKKKRSKKLKLIEWKKYGAIELTEEGRKYAAHFTNHHFIVEKFLKETLLISDELAHREAIKISGVISCDLINVICKKYNFDPSALNFQFCEQRNYKIH